MRTLPMHATGKSAPWPLVAASLALAQTAFVAAAAALVAGADELASGSAGAREPVLAAHLAGAVFFPLAVTGASWHLLPVMLRNSLPKPRRLWLVLGLFCGGVVLAPGVAAWSRPVAWVGAAMLAAGLALAVAEIAGLVRRAPQGKVLVVSRIGVALSAFHAVVAFALGAVVFGLDRPAVLGIPFERLVLIHLVVAVLGWLTLLVLSVGRTLAPMLALAPAPGARRCHSPS